MSPSCEIPFWKRTFPLSLLFLCLVTAPVRGVITGYLKIPDIPGESQSVDHEDEIDIHRFEFHVGIEGSFTAGSGRTRASAEFGDLILSKYTDASSVYLYLAVAQGKVFDEIVFTVRKDSGEAHLDYLVITMTNCVITSYHAIGGDGTTDLPVEKIGIGFERIKYFYVEQAEDHSAGDEHEIEYDIAAGV